jgi:hypothetical protein
MTAAVKLKYYWMPVEINYGGYIRIAAYGPEEALDKVEGGDFTEDEVLNLNIQRTRSTGAPTEETTA